MLKWTMFLVLMQATYSISVKIVSPYKEGPDPCVLVCAGTTGIGTTRWINHGTHLITTVDMSECGFVSLPIVSTTVSERIFNYS